MRAWALALCLPLAAADPITPAQAIGEGVALGLTLVDWAQTSQIADNRNYAYWEETNPFLPKHPRRRNVNRWFAASLAVQSVTFYYLPSKWRGLYLAGYIGLEAGSVQRNALSGVRIRF